MQHNHGLCIGYYAVVAFLQRPLCCFRLALSRCCIDDRFFILACSLQAKASPKHESADATMEESNEVGDGLRWFRPRRVRAAQEL